jgi:TatD DNase family protein
MAAHGLPVTDLLRRAGSDGLSLCVDIGTHPKDLEQRRSLLRDFSRGDVKAASGSRASPGSGGAPAPAAVFTAGIYPSHSRDDGLASVLELLASQLAGDCVVACGEIGIDFHWDYGTREEQQALFETQIALANESRKPIVIHCRESEGAILESIDRTPPRFGAVLHCFSSDEAFADELIERDLYLSFGGNLSYKRSEGIRAACARVPVDRLLLETDSPYLAPQEVRGRENVPGHIGYTYELAARVRGEPLERLVNIVGENTGRLFDLDPEPASG